jgi:actin-like ATPase involved in cell morphogenesis
VGYHLGVDLGTTYTAAATRTDGRVRIVTLGTRAPVVPSVVCLRPDGQVLVGEAAARREAGEPDRLAREFKRRMGDQTPILLGGSPLSPTALTARLLAAVVSTVVAEEGVEPDHLIVTCPANWGAYKRDLLGQAVELAGACRGDVTIVSEPEAVAAHYAAGARVEPGQLVAVYDLGGGTFDAAVLVNTGEGHEVLGDPTGVEQLGGIDFDDAVLAYVTEQVVAATGPLDPDDPAVVQGQVGLRRACVEAKEALSYDTEVAVPVVLPDVQTQVRITRGEFERLIRPTLAVTLASLDRALRAANVAPADLAAVVLAGGSSRIPLVAQLVTEELGRPVAVDLHPKHAVALGAALLGPARAATAPTVPILPVPQDVTEPTEVAPPEPGPEPPDVPEPAAAGRFRGRRLAVAGVLTLIAAAFGVLALATADPDRRAGSEAAVGANERMPARDGGDDGGTRATDPAASTTSTTPVDDDVPPPTPPPRRTSATTTSPPSTGPDTTTPATPPPTALPPDPGLQWHEVATGDCLDDLDDDPLTVTGVDIVGCDSPHEYEAAGVVSKAPGPYPGTVGLAQEATDQCARVRDFANAFRPDIVLGFAIGIPSQQEWDRGVQELGCFLGLADGSRLTGRIAG